ncbi:DUF1488 domain-containing protein [Providencia hangzhouensis]|uniref:DUF1488 domain-containing protein n=1 Tax=Providencia rettgeri TaxID=587 RepID=A0AAJ4TIB4_PRORE|nr:MULTISPECIES: DUF1488 domain-containing protein [Providencia]MBJ9973575.1 DUF1488 domain-containing protein [Providencia rettgeri]MCB6146210.1 DUF1488 domain-containing protein [Providencia rettgeri]MCF8965123.1 hypothetical protein [Providencia rettgeri]MDB9569355.1 DUF1488 domain-containing protein [Providencia rettgeri]QWQ16753.1 DUF1488 domain-containing protein [Providencia rettgeri]
MNQQIQFPDREEWDALSKQVRFPVLISGMLAECAISQSLLFQRYGKEETPLSLFQQHRWDIEEEFEALIEQGLDDYDGFYILSDAK